MGWRTIPVLLAVLAWPLKSELLSIRTYTTSDGLGSDHVNSIAADSRGFLWFCTREGLSRFDGYHFVTYTTDEGLPHNLVSTLLETRSGEYFAGTARGISRINPGPGARFTNYAPEPKPADNFVTALREGRGGKIWCATTVGALYEWDRSKNFRRRALPLPAGEQINDILEDPQGALWVATTAGLYVLGDRGPFQTFFTRNPGTPENRVSSLFLDSRNRMWATVRGGVAMFVPDSKGAWILERMYTEESGVVGHVPEPMAESRDGILWVGSDWGISLISLASGEPRVVKHISRDQGLSDRHILALAIDQAGNVWAGSEGAGAMRIDRQGFSTFHEQDGLATDRLTSVFEDRAGQIVALTVTGFLKRSIDVFDGVRFHSVQLPVFDGHASWLPNRILLESRNGGWWAATSEGLCRFAAVKAPELAGTRPDTCYPSGTVFQIFEDSRNRIWASAQSGKNDQLMRWDPQTNALFVFPSPRVPGGLNNDIVDAFAEDRQGNIWMGLRRGGLYRYDGRSFRYFQTSDGMPGGSIWAVLADESGIWIGSNGGGLAHVTATDQEHPHVRLYGTAHGLASNIVFCLAADAQGRIYAGTGKGIDRFDPRTGRVRHFSSANGLARGEIAAAFRDRSGVLWFATTQGLSRIDPAPERPSVQPRVLITDLRVGTAPWPVSQLGQAGISNLELKSSQNQLQVEFAGLDYEAGDSLRFVYMLEGADQAWGPPRAQHLVNYAALSPGKYRFLVKAVTAEGVESGAPAEVDFVVLPPLWRRWWFEALMVLLAAAVVLVAHRYRVAQMVSLERIRTTIATDLHDDIGASLSQIAILSEVARLGVNGQAHTGDALDRVATLARELVDSMGDIVWSIRSEPHGMESLIRRMREFAIDLLVSQGIGFELRSSTADVLLTLQTRRQLFLIFKEAIHNAARHSRATHVEAELRFEDRDLVLMVKDNGAGFHPEAAAGANGGGNGIPSMCRRAGSLGGDVQFASAPGRGCSVTVRLPLQRSRLGKADADIQ